MTLSHSMGKALNTYLYLWSISQFEIRQYYFIQTLNLNEIFLPEETGTLTTEYFLRYLSENCTQEEAVEVLRYLMIFHAIESDYMLEWFCNQSILNNFKIDQKDFLTLKQEVLDLKHTLKDELCYVYEKNQSHEMTQPWEDIFAPYLNHGIMTKETLVEVAFVNYLQKNARYLTDNLYKEQYRYSSDRLKKYYFIDCREDHYEFGYVDEHLDMHIFHEEKTSLKVNYQYYLQERYAFLIIHRIDEDKAKLFMLDVQEGRSLLVDEWPCSFVYDPDFRDSYDGIEYGCFFASEEDEVVDRHLDYDTLIEKMNTLK